MFDTNLDIKGKHANYLKDLCELRENVPDKDAHNNFKIFKSYVDAYILCPLVGFQYNRKGETGPIAEGNVGILAEQIINRKSELTYVYQILMLIDEESEPDCERRIYRSFNFSENNEEDKAMIKKNMQIFNAYFLGGIEVLHERFVDGCAERDQYLREINNFTKEFYEEQSIGTLKTNIDAILK